MAYFTLYPERLTDDALKNMILLKDALLQFDVIEYTEEEKADLKNANTFEKICDQYDHIITFVMHNKLHFVGSWKGEPNGLHDKINWDFLLTVLNFKSVDVVKDGTELISAQSTINAMLAEFGFHEATPMTRTPTIQLCFPKYDDENKEWEGVGKLPMTCEFLEMIILKNINLRGDDDSRSTSMLQLLTTHDNLLNDILIYIVLGHMLPDGEKKTEMFEMADKKLKSTNEAFPEWTVLLTENADSASGNEKK
jgi:hypothetical protein